MNKIAKKILIFGISLIALSFLLLIHFEWEEKYSKRESNNIMNKLIDEESKNEENNLIVINDLEYIVREDDFLFGEYIILKRGKKNYYIGVINRGKDE